MHDSGHTERFRSTVVSRVIGKYTKNLENHRNGTKRMFRTREEREEQIKLTGGRKTKSTWYRTDKTTTITTVPTTPGGLLARQMTETLAMCPAPGKCKTRVQEGVGRSVERNLVSSNPFPRQSCGRLDCPINICLPGGCAEECYKEGVGYQSTCTRCRTSQLEQGTPEKEVENHSYLGETARTLYTRAKQHLAAYRSHLPGRKPSESWMWSHTLLKHDGVFGPQYGATDYQFRVQGRFTKPMQRQVDEAVRLGQVDNHGLVLDDAGGHWGGQVVCQNTRGEY